MAVKSVRWGWILAVALGTVIGIYTASCGADNQPEAASEQYVIASGPVTETAQKYWNIGGVTIMIAPKQWPADVRLRDLNGVVVDVIIRRVR